MSSEAVPCDECGRPTGKATLVYRYSIDAHDLDLQEQAAQYCPTCASTEEVGSTHGAALDPQLLESINQGMCRLFGEQISTRCLQGDEDRILVHVRRS